MKTAIIYASMSGHSRKIANAIGEAMNITPQNIKENMGIPTADLLFVVGGIYGDQSMPELVDYVKKLTSEQVKQACLITSSAKGTVKQRQVREILEGNGITVLEEEFVCLGGFLFKSMGHPNKTEIENSVMFAKGISANV